MQDIISSAAFAAGRNLAAQGFACKRSHLTETIAALLGYSTYAAFVTEEDDETLEYHNKDAECFIVHWALAVNRAQALGLPEAAPEACYQALRDATETLVYRDVADFWDSEGRSALESEIEDGVVTADSNATYSDPPELEEGEESEDVWEARDVWTIEAKGVWVGEYDPDGERMYNGHKIDVWGRLYYAKAGRVGLIYQDSEVGGMPAHEEREYEDDFM